MQKFRFTLVILTTLLFSSCGGVSTNPIETVNNINKRAAIFIIRGVSTGVCKSYLFKTALDKALTGVITHEEPKSFTCNNFDRKNDRRGCYQENYTATPGDLACIIGYDGVKENEKNENILGAFITGTILDIFIRLAE
ncbi:MAG: hypothetical protein L3J43_07025 [Sulfurovum sp.]|nr:hypothetical protein [Sulfurovum sp.]